MKLDKEQRYAIEEALFEFHAGRKLDESKPGIKASDFVALMEVNPTFHRILEIVEGITEREQADGQ